MAIGDSKVVLFLSEGKEKNMEIEYILRCSAGLLLDLKAGPTQPDLT